MNLTLSQHLARNISNELIRSIPFESIRQQFAKKRPQQIQKASLDYMMKTFTQINKTFSIKPTYIDRGRKDFDESKQNQYAQESQKIKRKMNVRTSRINPLQKTRRSSFSIRNSKLMKSNYKQSKGLVKLITEQDDQQKLGEYIQKLRQKKIRIAEALGQFEKSQAFMDKNSQPEQLLPRGHLNQPKAIITDFEGQIIKTDRKPIKKQKGFWLQKSKVKPLFRLKESLLPTSKDLYNNQIDSDNNIDCTINSLKICQHPPKKQRNSGLNIKSILDVFTTRKTLQLKKSRRNAYIR